MGQGLQPLRIRTRHQGCLESCPGTDSFHHKRQGQAGVGTVFRPQFLAARCNWVRVGERRTSRRLRVREWFARLVGLAGPRAGVQARCWRPQSAGTSIEHLGASHKQRCHLDALRSPAAEVSPGTKVRVSVGGYTAVERDADGATAPILHKVLDDWRAAWQEPPSALNGSWHGTPWRACVVLWRGGQYAVTSQAVSSHTHSAC
jgi:hypothetical protein